MSQDQDVFRKVGRGGAGNYYVSSKQADEATKDLEAQQLKAVTAAVAVAASPSVTAPLQPQGPARAGRGGAGNFIDPGYAAQNQGRLASETGAAVASSLKKNPQPHRSGWSGRGGAGNFKWELAAEDETSQGGESIAELDKKIREAVEGTLKMPERAHHHLNKEDEEQE